ncbi:hypothetical protein CROQUDRAFT_660951 [Cronartium quercuum f. sp. fusiforme G11]|uniref:Cysteine proteinase 1, mitochondrial n=1 Tax=Cronartium quercuum f. sp. fusiforme G11 TaxID=708437 RepID=A0A9P6T9I6_9BASI|nr:hypothetical protein CROQUDRAFT_660951 [Cronartium quercuum f. sp. fusiforme G11]
MGSQSSKPQTSSQTYDEKLNRYSSPQARSDAASTAALRSRLNLSVSARQSSLAIVPSNSNKHPAPELSLDAFTRWQNDFARDDKAQLASTLLSKQHLASALLSRQVITADKQVFSETLTVQPTPVTNQKSSGRCWLFATCNVIRMGIVKKFNLGDFELSQSYLFFYDHLEKANWYLENMIELVEEPLDARIISHLSSSPQGDGGQWDMVVGLIEKYGLVPKSIYDESYNSSNSSGIGSFITSQLRDQALELRHIYHDTKAEALKTHDEDLETAVGAALRATRQAKETMMGQIFHCLAIALGTPPNPTETFRWDYVDKTGKAHTLVSTPLDFYHKHTAGFKASEYISLINDPRNTYEKAFTVERLGNVWGGRPIKYVNTSSEMLKSLVIKMIKSDQAVWFGCDVGQQSNSTYGIMDTKLIEYEAAFGRSSKLSKAERLVMGESAMTHAMVITAVHLDSQGKPVRYKVENSWSDTAGEHGYFVMSDAWFDEFVYQIVLPKSAVPESLRNVYFNTEPSVLPAWDPMGSLA